MISKTMPSSAHFTNESFSASLERPAPYLFLAELNRLISRKATRLAFFLSYALTLAIAIGASLFNTSGYDTGIADISLFLALYLPCTIIGKTAISPDKNTGHLTSILMWMPSRHHFYLARSLALASLLVLCTLGVCLLQIVYGTISQATFFTDQSLSSILIKNSKLTIPAVFLGLSLFFTFAIYDLADPRKRAGTIIFLIFNGIGIAGIYRGLLQEWLTGNGLSMWLAGLAILTCAAALLALSYTIFTRQDIQ